jgi:general secretion pathway protein C
VLQNFLRRNFFVVHLLAIVLFAYMTAAIATDLGSAMLLKALPASFQPERGSSAPKIEVLKPPGASLASIVGDRNPFDAEPKTPEEEEGTEAHEPEAVALSDLGIQLVGTLVSSKPEWSFVIVKVQNESKLFGVGSSIQDKATIVEVAQRYMVVEIGQKREFVKLGEQYGGGPKVATLGPPRIAPPVPGGGQTDYSRGVRKVGPYEYQIDRAMLEENLQDLSKLGMEARIIPNYVDGKYQGFRLVGLTPNSLLRAIGLESGDLVTRVNGQDIDTPNKALQLFEQLRASPTISLDIERRGQKATMTYKVK